MNRKIYYARIMSKKRDDSMYMMNKRNIIFISLMVALLVVMLVIYVLIFINSRKVEAATLITVESPIVRRSKTSKSKTTVRPQVIVVAIDEPREEQQLLEVEGTGEENQEQEGQAQVVNEQTTETTQNMQATPTTPTTPTEQIVHENINDLDSTSYYYITVNNEANVVTIYAKDDRGEYNIPVKAMLCSTGTYTPQTGKYLTTGYKRKWNGLQGDVYGQYATQIVGNILFHSVPYEQPNPSSLEYWEYDKLGTSASLGCIRMKVEDVKWIYDNIPAGTIVEFYSDPEPGPLGKPELQKISDNTDCRNWDPTDYVSGNPWLED